MHTQSRLFDTQTHGNELQHTQTRGKANHTQTRGKRVSESQVERQTVPKIPNDTLTILS